MSLSKPTSNQNPAKKFIEWKGSQAAFVYYNKETEEEITLKSPLYIIVLDQLSTISGFNDEDNSGIYSNEIRNTVKQELTVKTKKGIIAKGLYQDIKTKIIQAGGKFAKSVYAVLITGNKKNTSLELVNFKFVGSSLSPFIDAKIGDTGEVIFLDKNPEQKKKGSNIYFEPIVKKLVKREDILEKAIAIDKELQEYLDVYFSNSLENEHKPQTQPESTFVAGTPAPQPNSKPEPEPQSQTENPPEINEEELNEVFPEGMPF